MMHPMLTAIKTWKTLKDESNFNDAKRGYLRLLQSEMALLDNQAHIMQVINTIKDMYYDD